LVYSTDLFVTLIYQFYRFMKVINKIQNWGDHHHPKWLDLFRIALGAVLIWKGIAFTLNFHAITRLMMDVGFGTAISISLIAHVVIGLHLIGGLFIAMGSLTRLFCLLNLPVLFGAVFFVNLQPSIFAPYAEIWLSVAVLLGLICFLIEGNGVLSVEYDGEPTAL
jgi:putative oxidoreductase